MKTKRFENYISLFLKLAIQIALFWHKEWVNNDRPVDDNNIIANIRRSTRETYHKARKMAIKNEGLIVSDNLAHSLEDEPIDQFWNKVKRLRPNNGKVSSTKQT